MTVLLAWLERRHRRLTRRYTANHHQPKPCVTTRRSTR
jgi:hypothetical protein